MSRDRPPLPSSHTTVHLWRVRPARVPLAVVRMGWDRWLLRRVEGLVFHKLVGTGDGRTFSPADADPSTWGLVTVWRTAADAAAFEAHRTPRGWRRIAEEEWRGDLACLRARGEWSGRTPFTPSPAVQGWEGPVASLTRARLRLRRVRTFWRSVPAVVADLEPPRDDSGGQEVGPVLRIGIGEAPIGLQGTFTMWPDAAALASFAYRRPAHRRAIADTQRLDWYAEELFARFAVLAQRGTVSGSVPPLEWAGGRVPAGPGRWMEDSGA